MKRFIEEKLEDWKNKEYRKPLVLHGARQVGKTWIMKAFGRHSFESVVYINFENNERMKRSFEIDYDIRRILSDLEIESRQKIIPEQMLIIFDEIQEAPKAMTALKYFAEEAPEYYVIAAGSLLGMSLHEGTSFPVGKVDILKMYPMTFGEFLVAAGHQQLYEALQNNQLNTIATFKDQYLELLKRYYYIGGMPEAVQRYIDTDDLTQVRNIQKNLLLYYESDFSKHVPYHHLPRIQMVWNSIPAQLAKENRKFVYGIVREGSRAKDYEIAIQWLQDYGLVTLCHRVKKPGIPLIAYMEQASFKMYILDVGLLGAKADLDAKTILNGNDIFVEFKGALTEQFIAQELSAAELKLYYYSTENSSGEIDFLLQMNNGVVPIEVKAQENLKAQSLRNYCKKYTPETAIRTSMSGFRQETWMINVPLFYFLEYVKSKM
ncbi:MAG: ATP-binding protein [Parasporobacterium sp.]|nr:ATP-binding protein [Parasporobacterium sp.]